MRTMTPSGPYRLERDLFGRELDEVLIGKLSISGPMIQRPITAEQKERQIKDVLINIAKNQIKADPNLAIVVGEISEGVKGTLSQKETILALKKLIP